MVGCVVIQDAVEQSPLWCVGGGMGGWPGLRCSCGDLSVGVVPSSGGRVMSFSLQGVEIFYIPEYFFVEIPERTEDLRVSKRRSGFPVLGGNRVWPAPEKDWWEQIPPVDIDRAPYAVREEAGELVMTSPVCRETGLRVIRRVLLAQSGRIRITEIFENTGSDLLEKGIWSVTQIPRPFEVYLPCHPTDVRSYHSVDFTLPDPCQAPEAFGEWTKLPVRSNVCFKFGALYRAGAALLVKETPQGILSFMKLFAVSPGKKYPHGSSVEVFNSSVLDYGELEVHSPLWVIPAGGRVSFSQELVGKLFPLGTPLEIVLRDNFIPSY